MYRLFLAALQEFVWVKPKKKLRDSKTQRLKNLKLADRRTVSYDRQILEVLIEAGERGIGVRSIVKHIYNRNRTFFFTPDYEEIRAQVRRFLSRNSRSAHSLVQRAGRRGYYRLNTSGNTDARQMMLSFREGEQARETAGQREEERDKPREDLSLDLFG